MSIFVNFIPHFRWGFFCDSRNKERLCFFLLTRERVLLIFSFILNCIFVGIIVGISSQQKKLRDALFKLGKVAFILSTFHLHTNGIQLREQ